MALNDYWRQNPFSKAIAGSGAASGAGGDAPLLPEEADRSGGSSVGGVEQIGLSARLATGSGGSSGGSTFQECFDSSSCAIGWRCIGNTCVPPNGIAGSDGADNDYGCGGDGGSGGGGGGGGCGPGGSAGGGTGTCTKTGCGDPGPDGGGGGPNGGCCSNQKCCRPGGCSCGPCPPPGDSCQQFCSDYKAANGEDGPGCGPDSSCDQCEFCNEEGECEKDENNNACYCGGTEGCLECEDCNEDGTCFASPSSCLKCCTVSIECSCGITLQKECCFPLNTGSQDFGQTCRGRCLAQLQAGCDAQCPPPPDEPEPEPCDCNCDNDCGDCEICNAAGVCVPDPACQCGDVSTFQLTITRDSYSIAQQSCGKPNDCGEIGSNPSASWTVGLNAKGPLSVSYSNSGPEYYEGSCGNTVYVPGSQTIIVRDCEGNVVYQTVLQGPGNACAGDTQITGSATVG